METTTLYVELLIIGFEVIAWLGLFLASLIDVRRLAVLPEKLEAYSLLVTLSLFGVAYLLGIVFDKITHFLFGAQRGYLKKLLHGDICNRVEEEPDEDHRQIYARIMLDENRAGSDMLYGRSKVRILRASVINVPLITVAAAIFLNSSGDSRWWQAALVGLIFWLIVLGTYVHTQRLYYARLQRLRKHLDT